jgi:adenylate cyclase
LAGDVAGYSRLVEADEEGTLARLRALRAAVIDPTLASHRGRVFKTTGDGFLAEFASVVDAARCASALQAAFASHEPGIEAGRRIVWRLGLNLGDVVVEGGDVHGDGVNVAARLEALAEPGTVCVSAAARDQLQGKLELAFEDLGEQALKNIARPVRVYRLAARATAEPARPALPLPDKPSLVVLPFQNMSGDAEQEYFADGMTEEIISGLSRLRSLFVIARNSSFALKGAKLDMKQIGRELGVRYALEGSVRRAGNQVRIAAQLTEIAECKQLWADRFDGTLQDVFKLQDDVAARVISSLTVQIEKAEIERASRRSNIDIDAYDCLLRARAAHYWPTRESIEEGLRLAREAVAIDPKLAGAHALIGWLLQTRFTQLWFTDLAAEIAEADRASRRAIELAPEDAEALGVAGYVLAYMVRDIDAGASAVARALLLSPNLSLSWVYSGWIRLWSGEPSVAIEHFSRCMRLDPLDPNISYAQVGMAIATFALERFAEAHDWARLALREWPHSIAPLRIAAAAAAMAGKAEEAAEYGRRLRARDPTLCVSMLATRLGPHRDAVLLARFADGLRRAGLPE